MTTGKILIVDDEPVNLMLIERLLEDAGHTDFTSTTDPHDALRLVREMAPDLILLDLHMPRLDGFGVLEQLAPIRAAAGLLPVLVLTADATLETKRRALAAGATDFLPKPFDTVEAALRINNLLTMRRGHVRIEEAVQERTAELRRALTELDARQQQIVQKERLSALGAMTTGIAHDFNNALAIILGFGELMHNESQRELRRAVVEKYARTIVTAAEDAAAIIRRLRDFHRPAVAHEVRRPISLNEIVESAINFTRPRWENQSLGDGIKLEVIAELQPVPAILGHGAELREMLTNLIFNAVDAMPAGGTITLRTALRGDRVDLQIADTGSGMSEETRRRALEPFFTTKGERGSGLGLAMVYGSVQRHGGTLDLASTPGVGTTFHISLPVATGSAPEQASGPAKAGAPLRILMVDDKLVLCDIVAEFLTRDQHSVTTVSDAEAALEAFAAAPFDLVITDRIMPEMCGDQLALVLKERAPTIPIILLTGYHDSPADGQEEIASLPGIELILQKPATHAALRDAIAIVMAKPRAI